MIKHKHLQAVNESYFLHMKNAFAYTLKLAYATCAVFIHAFFPFWHQDTASTIAGKIYLSVKERKNNEE
jgi:hypothetical protein